jgi:hypothetical protein
MLNRDPFTQLGTPLRSLLALAQLGVEYEWTEKRFLLNVRGNLFKIHTYKE